MTRSLAAPSSRRKALAGVALLGHVAGMVPDGATAKKRRKRKKVKRNEFGCVNVGRFCRKASQCCSGICQGKKGKKTCKAHDTGDCQPGPTFEECGAEENVPCINSNGNEGRCATTTGNAGYCSNAATISVPPCTRDADCEDFDPRAACVLCPEGDTPTVCARFI
jgi:hypothetical protein